jgi:hypothetical protein
MSAWTGVAGDVAGVADEFVFDDTRAGRIGLDEAIFAHG